MNDLTRVAAAFSVGAGAYGECDIDITGLTPDQIAEIVMTETNVSTTVCHECSRNISDPEIEEMTSFRVGDVDYEFDGRHWVVAS